MFVKRVLHTLRNKLVTITQLIVPLFFTTMGIVVVRTLPSFINQPALRLTPDQFGLNIIPFYSNSPATDALANAYIGQFQRDSLITTVNVNRQSFQLSHPSMQQYLIKQGERSIGDFNLKYMVAGDFSFSNTTNRTNVLAYFNNQGFHSIAVSLAIAFNGVLQYLTNSTDYSIETYNHPLPRLPANKVCLLLITYFSFTFILVH